MRPNVDKAKSGFTAFPTPCAAIAAAGSTTRNPTGEATLDGRPKLAYEFWHDHLRPLGFHLEAELLEYPGGMPVGFILSWK